MKLMRLFLLGLLLGLHVGAASATELKSFTADSLTAIKSHHAGKPFLLVLWSQSCHFCVQGLGRWGALQKRYPGVPIVLINTDAPDEAETVKKLLKRSATGKVETWIFADAYAEPLRWSIDPQWRGELPRTYFFDKTHKAEARSGMVDDKEVEAWLKARGGQS